jgi:soluble lytic murein transglycosylase-like protein
VTLASRKARARTVLREVLILIALLICPLVTGGCEARMLWGQNEADLARSLAAGQYGALAAVDFASQNPADALSLSPQAPYYLSFVFDALGKSAQSLSMLELAAARCPSPWKEEARLLLAERYITLETYDRAIELARGLAGSAKDPGVQERAQRVLVEALYWGKEDAAALQEAARLAHPDAEVLLFRAVSSMRLALAPAHALMLQLFMREKASSLHSRVYTYLLSEPAYLQLFSQAEQDLLKAKAAIAQGDWSTGIPLMEKVVAAMDPSMIAGSSLVEDLSNAYLSASRAGDGARFMEKLASRLSGAAHVDALERAGRLYRRAKEFPRALVLLEQAASLANTRAQQERVHWYILDVVLQENLPDLVSTVQAESSFWSDPSYYADLLEDKIADLVAARSWTTLEGLWRVLETSGPDELYAELSYIIARAWQEGAIRRLPGTPTLAVSDLFAAAVRKSPDSYYGILSASLLGETPSRAIPAEPGKDDGSKVALDPLGMGFLQFGLFEQAYGRVWATRDSLDETGLLEAARRFSAAGDMRSSLRFVGLVARKRRLSAPELQMLYPRAYADLIEPLAAGAGIPEHILYGLVREESYFDPDIVSSAGAIGLSQLMPQTAAPIARRLHMSAPDLTDPTTNLTIGARHLKDLLSNVDSPIKALLSYNAGLARLRQWEKAARGLPVDLFVESVPIAETRQYVRKILVSSVMYAFLYHDTDPREAALSFFNLPKLRAQPNAQPPGAARPQ